MTSQFWIGLLLGMMLCWIGDEFKTATTTNRQPMPGYVGIAFLLFFIVSLFGSLIAAMIVISYSEQFLKLPPIPCALLQALAVSSPWVIAWLVFLLPAFRRWQRERRAEKQLPPLTESFADSK